MHLRSHISRFPRRVLLNLLFCIITLSALIAGYTVYQTLASTPGPVQSLTANQAFSQSEHVYGVPAPLLKAICYTEGRLSNNAGAPSADNGFGCMHLVKNSNADTLDSAAKAINVTVSQLQQSLPTNIRGGAAVLHADALQLSSTHTLPATLGGWYGTLALYSDATVRSTALLYATNIYKVLNQGFNGQTDQGEAVTLAPQHVTPETSTASAFHAATNIPAGCSNDGKVDYPGAIDCILSPASIYDCNVPTSPSDCSYTSSDRPASCTVETTEIQPCQIDQVVIHDTEGSLNSALNVFQCAGTGSLTCEQSSVQYIVDTDGTVYQVLPEQDIAYHVGNFWYNEHSVGIEHVGFDATGYEWYNSAQYEASAKLTAYLLKKYNLPLDRAHVVAHATVPASTLSGSPNHVDPGPYWLWDYYFNLISQQGVPLSKITPPNTITLRPTTDQEPDGANGTETKANFNFFYLYTGSSTKSGFIPEQGGGNDITDVSYNVEAGISYYIVATAPDAAGTGATMYEIWYGEEDQVHTSQSSYFADAKLAWLAVPAGDGVVGTGLTLDSQTFVKVSSSTGNTAQIYSRPTTSGQYVIGEAPVGAIFTTAYTLTEDSTINLWYEINYNHRQAWLPASEVSHFHTATSTTPAG